MLSIPPSHSIDDLKTVIERHWGFRSFRPLQEPAMRAVLDDRDSLVVMPTGGGKSLCYQAPAVLRGATTVVVSPLIALMKDQVDGLQASGVPAIQIDSLQSLEARNANEMDIIQGAVRLLFVSPERLVLPGFQRLLHQINARTFAIDEAHCISHWGHDFRPEYRQLKCLKEIFPGACIHGYTATATERVRRDIVEQLGLENPEVLVGNFDRPNLTYRILPRHDLMKQVLEVLDRHAKEAGIIYCLSRRDVDGLSLALQERGYQALPYHAGLPAEQRKTTQDAFAAEKCDLVVATIAFGMGIDRSNIRFVLHATMPKSVEHYQQETGRAGRDGLEAECILLHSGEDFRKWEYILKKSAAEPGVDKDFLPSALKHLNDVDRYCRGAVCRHRALVQYFGQKYSLPACQACDLCLGDKETVPNALELAQKILSCVARVKERFGVNHVVGVLRGENTENIRKHAHDQLSTYGLLNDHGKADIRDWIHQLIGQEMLLQEGEEYPILRLNAQSWEVMKGQRPVRLVQLLRRQKGEKLEKSQADVVSWEGVDRDLFDSLRGLRRQLAEERGVQPYVIFHDSALRELARVRPSRLETMHRISGIGAVKLRDFGDRVLKIIREHCREKGVDMDIAGEAPAAPQTYTAPRRISPERELAFGLFRRGAPIEEAVEKTGRKRSTIVEYLCDFIHETRPASIARWITEDLYQRIDAASRHAGTTRLKPVFLALDEQVPYDDIRLVMAHLSVREK